MLVSIVTQFRLSEHMSGSRIIRLLLFLHLLLHSVVATAQGPLEISITYLSRQNVLPEPLSLLDVRIEDEGIRGAELGLKDNQTTGKFLKHEYRLKPLIIPAEQTLDAALASANLSPMDLGIIVADLEESELLSVADRYPDSLLLNTRATGNSLRMEECRSNVYHVAASRAMLTDALAQYLYLKRWTKVVLITGRHAADALYAESMKRSITRFGLKLIQQKNWTSIPGARRTDSGHHSLQQEVPAFTRFKKHDVIIVADEADEFGEYLTYVTSEPKLVVGTQGLLSTTWHRSHEQWGGTQLQRRFSELANRFMTSRDYAAWTAMRAIGEAVTNTSSFMPAVLKQFLMSDRFKLAAFKGKPLTFRQWNGQLRQPVLIAGPRMLISVSPQDGFLHERTELDTLGFDLGESACKAFGL